MCYLHSLLVVLCMLMEIRESQSRSPVLFVEIEQHLLLKFVLSIINCDRVVVSVQAMDQCLDAWLVQVTDIGGCLARFVAHCCGLGIDQTESINDDLALD